MGLCNSNEGANALGVPPRDALRSSAPAFQGSRVPTNRAYSHLRTSSMAQKPVRSCLILVRQLYVSALKATLNRGPTRVSIVPQRSLSGTFTGR